MPAPSAQTLGQLFRGFCLLGLCQIMPGPNVMNLALCLGVRFQGGRGALVAPAGMMLAPLLLLPAGRHAGFLAVTVPVVLALPWNP